MKTVTVSRRSKAINDLLEQARAEDLFIKSADGTEFMLTAVDDFDREIVATRRNEKLMAFLEECARQPELIPIEEVKEKLGLNSKTKANGKSTRRKAR